MTLTGVIGIGTLSLGIATVLAAGLQLGADELRYANVNLATQFPYPWGPSLGNVLLLGTAATIIGLVLVVRTCTRTHA